MKYYFLFILVFSFGLVLQPNVGMARKKGERATVSVKAFKKRKRKGRRKKKRRPKISQAALMGRGVEKKFIKGVGKTISYLKKTVKQMPKRSSGRLEMLERILNLNVERAAFVASAEQDSYDRRWRAWARKGSKGPEPKASHKTSRSHWREVFKYSKLITKEFPRGRHSDKIAFNAALALQFLGKEKKAAKQYSIIIKRYPKSPIAGDAYFSLGDFYFDRNDFRSALGYYKSAVKYKRSKRYGWALFKLAWCYYNVNEYSKALTYWKKTVVQSDRLGRKKGHRLRDEALRDMIFAFAELRKIDDALRFYKRNSGEKYISKFLKLLAEIYSDQGEFKQAIRVWKKLLNLYPMSPESVDAQQEIIALNYELRDLKRVWIESERLAKNYSKRSRWAKRNEKSLVKDTQKNIYKLLSYYPKLVHKDSQKYNSKAGFNQAKRGYRLFLKQFPRSKDLVEIKEYLGDIEYFQNNYRESGKIYLEIALMGKSKAIIYGPKGKKKINIHRRSSKNMLDSYNKDFLPELTAMLKTKPDFSKPARSLSPRAKNFIKGCTYYIKWYPKDKATVKKCEKFTSEIYYRGRNKKMALRYLWLMATKYPNDKEGSIAVENLIPLYGKNKKGLITAAKKLRKIPAYRKGKIGKKLAILMRSVELEGIAGETSHLKRAKLYEAQARKNLKDPDADKLWNNAAADYLKAGDITRAMKAFGIIVKAYPKSVAYPTALLQLGRMQDARMEYNKASDYYELYGRKYPRNKETPAVLQRSCFLQLAIESKRSISSCLSFANKFPDGGVIVIEKLIDSLWRKKSNQTMIKIIEANYLGKFKLTANQRIVALFKIYKGLGGKGRKAAAARQEIVKTFVSAGSASGEALRYVGELAFTSVQPAYAKFLTLKLRGGTVDALQGSIQQISGALVELEKIYGQVFQTKDSYWGVAAFFQLGFAYEKFAKQLKNPPGINGAKQSDVKKELSGSVKDVNAKAKALYTTGLQTARRFVVYNDWTRMIFNALNRIVNRNVTFEEWVIDPDFVASEIPGDVKSALR